MNQKGEAGAGARCDLLHTFVAIFIH